MLLRVFIFVLAITAAGGAAWLTTRMEPSDRAQVEARVTIPTAEILVAAADIPAGDVLSPDKLRWDTRPDTGENEALIRRASRPHAIDEMSGSFVNAAFSAGEPIRDSRLMATNVNLLSNKIEPGKRAVAVKVTAENTAGGFILPGDRVDVIQTVTLADGRKDSQIIISNVRVLAIDQTAVQTPEGSVLGKTATLELTPPAAERIMTAEASGLLSLALRSVADHDTTGSYPPEKIRSVRVYRATESTTVTIR